MLNLMFQLSWDRGSSSSGAVLREGKLYDMFPIRLEFLMDVEIHDLVELSFSRLIMCAFTEHVDTICALD